jgi:hypothetical protein
MWDGCSYDLFHSMVASASYSAVLEKRPQRRPILHVHSERKLQSLH